MSSLLQDWCIKAHVSLHSHCVLRIITLSVPHFSQLIVNANTHLNLDSISGKAMLQIGLMPLRT